MDQITPDSLRRAKAFVVISVARAPGHSGQSHPLSWDIKRIVLTTCRVKDVMGTQPLSPLHPG